MFNSSHNRKALENGAVYEGQNKQNEKQITSGKEGEFYFLVIFL